MASQPPPCRTSHALAASVPALLPTALVRQSRRAANVFSFLRAACSLHRNLDGPLVDLPFFFCDEQHFLIRRMRRRGCSRCIPPAPYAAERPTRKGREGRREKKEKKKKRNASMQHSGLLPKYVRGRERALAAQCLPSISIDRWNGRLLMLSHGRESRSGCPSIRRQILIPVCSTTL